MKIEGDDMEVKADGIKLSELNNKERQIVWRCRHINYGTVTIFVESGELTRVEEKRSYKLAGFTE